MLNFFTKKRILLIVCILMVYLCAFLLISEFAKKTKNEGEAITTPVQEVVAPIVTTVTDEPEVTTTEITTEATTVPTTIATTEATTEEEPTEFEMRATANVNIRTGAGTDFERIGKLLAGDIVTVVGEENGWYIIIVDRQRGYVIGDYLERVETEEIPEETTVTTVTTAPEETTVTTTEATTVTTTEATTVTTTIATTESVVTNQKAQTYKALDNVNVRAGAGTSYERLGMVYIGTKVTVLGQSGDWLQIEFNGSVGFVSAQWFEKVPEATTVATTVATTTTTKATTVTTTPTTVTTTQTTPPTLSPEELSSLLNDVWNFYPEDNLNSRNSYRNEMITVYNLATGKNVTMNAFELVCQIVYNEMRSSLHEEALKAQAVAAYSHIKYNFLKGTPAKVSLKSDYDAKIVAAVEAVDGLAMYYNGEYINAVYCASTGGVTVDAQSVWGGYLPYLVSVTNHYDHLDTKYYGRVAEFSVSDVRELIEEATGLILSNNYQNWIVPISYSAGGYIDKLVIDGQLEMSGHKFRSNVFGSTRLKSHNFTAEYVNGMFRITTYGWGHGVGMSQYGASYYGENGYTFDQILHHYYTGVVIK